MIQLYEFTPLPPHAVVQLIHYAFTHLPFYGFTVFSCSRCPRKNINLPIYGFTPLRKILHIYQIDHFTLRKRHAQIVNLRIYRFTGRFSGWNLPFYNCTVLRRALTKDVPLTRALHTDTAPEPSGTSQGICTGTLRNRTEPLRSLSRYLQRNPPQPHEVSAPEPSGTS